jgi:hypothetical protein
MSNFLLFGDRTSIERKHSSESWDSPFEHLDLPARVTPLVRRLESSVTDFGNILHFRKDRPTALNSNIQIPHAAQALAPRVVIEIWNFRVSGKWIKYGAFFPNFKLPFLGTELMRRGTRR